MKKITNRDMKTGRIQQQYDDEYMKELAEEYAVKRNAREISEREGIPLQTVYYYFRKFNKQKPRRLHDLNEDYFSKIDTEAKAYILGFIIADGCVSITSNSNPRPNRLFINISYKDRSVLELIRKELECDYEITDYIPENTFSKNMMSKISINSIKLCDDLAKLGVIQNKTGNEVLPKLSKEMTRHCIRGFLDGDGHVTHHTGGVTIGFTSDSKKILKQIKKVFDEELDIIGAASIRIDYPGEGRNSYGLKYHTHSDVEQIKEYLYKNSTIYLERKFNKL